MQIDSHIPSRLLFPNSFLLPGADTAVAVGANLPRNVKMPYAGTTVTALTKPLYEVPRPPIPSSACDLLHSCFPP